jgi:hypothetical protein
MLYTARIGRNHPPETTGKFIVAKQWNAFVGRLNPDNKPPPLEEIGGLLRAFLLPCISSASQELDTRQWNPSLHWSKTEKR